MARKKKTQQWQEFSMDYNGRTYHASYYTEKGMVTLKAMTKEASTIKNSTHIGGLGAETAARLLLKEFIDGGSEILP